MRLIKNIVIDIVGVSPDEQIQKQFNQYQRLSGCE